MKGEIPLVLIMLEELVKGGTLGNFLFLKGRFSWLTSYCGWKSMLVMNEQWHVYYCWFSLVFWKTCNELPEVIFKSWFFWFFNTLKKHSSLCKGLSDSDENCKRFMDRCMPEAFKKVSRYSRSIQCFFVVFMVKIVFCNPDFRNCGNHWVCS